MSELVSQPAGDGAQAGPLAVLARIAARRPSADQSERCEMCGVPLDEAHGHVVDLEARRLLCTCRPCYLLFTASSAKLRYRAVPERRLRFEGFRLAPGQWDDLDIPVGLAFLFFHSAARRTVAFYPGPAGATESELGLGAWEAVLEANPGLGTVAPDVEALLLHASERGGGDVTCHLVPVDACYALVGRLRSVWRGFDGGGEARAVVQSTFDDLDARSTPVPAGTAPAAAGAQ